MGQARQLTCGIFIKALLLDKAKTQKVLTGQAGPEPAGLSWVSRPRLQVHPKAAELEKFFNGVPRLADCGDKPLRTITVTTRS